MIVAFKAVAAEPVPVPAGNRLLNIRASLADGFFALAEQQSRGVLRAGPSAADEREAVLLLSHALWGQKRFSELLDALKERADEPGILYWRARALYELQQFDAALGVLSNAPVAAADSVYAPSALRLKGHALKAAGKLQEAKEAFQAFADGFPEHGERVGNRFDLAEVCTRLRQPAEAIAVYEGLAAGENAQVAQRARLKLAHVLHTQGNPEMLQRSRGLLKELAGHADVRLAYRIDAWVELAALEEAAGDYEKAMEALREAIALSPDARQRVPLKLSLIRLYLSEGQIEISLKLLEECRAEAPDPEVAAELQLEKARVLLQGKQFDEASRAYQIYLDVADDPEGLARARFGKGLALMELNRDTEAAVLLDKAVKGALRVGQKAEAVFKAGDAYYRAEKFDDARARYAAFLTDFPQHAWVPNALYQQGMALAMLGDRAGALEQFQILEAEHPASGFAEKAALRSAKLLETGAQWAEALAKYEQIGQTYTNGSAGVLSLYHRGLVLYQNLRRYGDAQAVFEQIIEAHPDSAYIPQATYLRGFCLYYQGQVEDAVSTCREFINKYPDSQWTPEVIFWLAEQYFNRSRYKEAEPLFLQIAADYADSKLAARALYWAGRVAAKQSNYVKAVERYSDVARLYPSAEILPQMRFAQGDALTQLGEFSRAVLAFEEIIKNYPESYLVNAAWGRKGDCQFSLAVDNPARYAEAMNSYQAILDRASSPASLRLQAEYKIGRCHEKSGAADKAFSRYMNVVYTLINENLERSSYTVMWFTRAAFSAASLKEKEHALLEAVNVYERVLEANVPAREEALNRIEKIKTEHWLLFQEAE